MKITLFSIHEQLNIDPQVTAAMVGHLSAKTQNIYSDPTAPMCSSQELKDLIEIHELQHMKDQIDPWFTTAKHIDAIDRR